ncbi:MAG: Hsp33 family molecular chaperone [Hyphomicrobiaceae bacterium]|nr:Hsp33 family molecular chaperone [Hyphomicrobiaceae bacterium]
MANSTGHPTSASSQRGGPQERAPNPRMGDDLVLPFRTVKSDLIGRVVRLGPLVDEVLGRHAYPEPVSHVLGEALALTAMLGSALKSEGKLILQTRTDGALNFLVTDYASPGHMRGYVSFKKDHPQLVAAQGRGDQGALIGKGHVAMTIDPNGDTNTYQGIVAVDHEPLIAVAENYFRQSEQLPTFIRLAVAQHYERGRGAHWRAGGLLLQKLPRQGGERTSKEGEEHDAILAGEDDEDWTRARHLAATVEEHELIDPTLSPERLLYRLFHEEGVRVFEPTPLIAACRCSRERIQLYLERFGAQELAGLREDDGGVTVTCEFCSRQYKFAESDLP